MAKKSNRLSEADLLAMGMKETFPGSGIYENKGKGTSGDFNGRDKIGSTPYKFPLTTRKHSDNIIDTLSVKNNEQFKANPISEWFLPYQTPNKKNSYRTFVDGNGKARTVTGKNIIAYKNVTKTYWMIFGKEFQKAIEYYKLSFPIRVEFTFIRKTNQHFDYIGGAETVQDFMQEFEWISDDCAKKMKPEFGWFEVNKQNPGVRIKLIL